MNSMSDIISDKHPVFLRRLGLGCDVYSNVMYKGKLLKDWRKDFKNQYTLGELFRMAQDDIDFEAKVSQ